MFAKGGSASRFFFPPVFQGKLFPSRELGVCLRIFSVFFIALLFFICRGVKARSIQDGRFLIHTCHDLTNSLFALLGVLGQSFHQLDGGSFSHRSTRPERKGGFR